MIVLIAILLIIPEFKRIESMPKRADITWLPAVPVPSACTQAPHYAVGLMENAAWLATTANPNAQA